MAHIICFNETMTNKFHMLVHRVVNFGTWFYRFGYSTLLTESMIAVFVLKIEID